MIVRVLGEGQFDVPDDRLDELNELDEEILRAVEVGDLKAFSRALEALLAEVRRAGSPMAHDHLGPSDLVLPGPDATLDEVRGLLDEEGLIPG